VAVKLVRADLAPFALPMATAVQTSRDRHQQREGLLIRIRSSDGLVGFGEATPLPSHGTESLRACEAVLRGAGAQLQAGVFSTVRELVAWLDDVVGTDHPAARCGLELALLDLLGQERGLPIASLLAHATHASIPVSALLVAEDVEGLAAEAEQRLREGFTTLKLKVGAGQLDHDLARIRAIDRAALMRLDANGGWSLQAARTALARLCAERTIELCEQPVSGLDDLLALRPAPCLIAADELLARRADADAVIASRGADVLVLKPMVLGGLTRALELAQSAEDAGLEVIVTTGLDGALARAGALHLAASCPRLPRASGLATGFVLAKDLGTEPIRCVDGRVAATLSPGLGVKPTKGWRWEALT
jgi:o-succinylbenzoate synthase